MEHKNYCNLVGAITKDVVVKETANSRVANINIVMEITYNDKTTKDYMTVVCWGELCDTVENLPKGSVINVTGKIQTRSYEAADGIKRYVTEVRANKIVVVKAAGSASTSNDDVIPNNNTPTPEDNDDLPF